MSDALIKHPTVTGFLQAPHYDRRSVLEREARKAYEVRIHETLDALHALRAKHGAIIMLDALKIWTKREAEK